MKAFSVREARKQLAHILKQVEEGEEVTILSRGRPVARVSRSEGRRPAFRSRAELRQSIPPMHEETGRVIRQLRDAERY